MTIKSESLTELFECLEAVLHDYITTYDPVEDRESCVATVSTQKMVALHEAYNRCKDQAHEVNYPALKGEACENKS